LSEPGACLRIADHGLISDLHSAALVGTDGTIDWYCCPRFDSPSVFGALLDQRRGGFCRIAPAAGPWTSKQFYFPDTNVLITRFFTSGGIGEVQDFMAIDAPDGQAHRQRIVRRMSCVRGQMSFAVEIEPRFGYASDHHETSITAQGAAFANGALTITAQTDVALRATEHGACAQAELSLGQRAGLVIASCAPRELGVYSDAETGELFDQTVRFWREWLGRSRYQGRWREMVHRSALTLKLLTYRPSGAILAAPTTSLPEQIGGSRNWDYRYAWIRDAAFSVYALLRLGFSDEAQSFMGWLTDRFTDPRDGSDGPLQIVYTIDGSSHLPERILDHLDGYRDSRPVRVGNAAIGQLQLDIYGELVDSVYLYNKHGEPISHDAWENLRRIIEWVCEHWDQTDGGIWETRGAQRHFTFSRLMSWVAVERAIRIARQRGLPADMVRWLRVRDQIYTQIMDRGWNPGRGAFVQHYDSDVLDASVLLMPLVKFVAPTDPRWLSTLDAIHADLVSDALVYRYGPGGCSDGLSGEEGTFTMCSFWFVEALTRAGRLDEARLAFEKMLTYANHLGLYSEQISATGELLGNFPQALTHLALISAAHNLDRGLG